MKTDKIRLHLCSSVAAGLGRKPLRGYFLWSWPLLPSIWLRISPPGHLVL
jgi:hypothetical protein